MEVYKRYLGEGLANSWRGTCEEHARNKHFKFDIAISSCLSQLFRP
jgi:hypothetical protein